MGNWRTVTIIGTCGHEDVGRLAKVIKDDDEHFHCLMNGGMLGLPNWAAQDIHATGNLAERDYSIEEVARTLELLSYAAPSLAVKVHCGGEQEDKVCVATITVVNRNVTIGPPEVAEVETVTQEQIKAQFNAFMRR